MRRTNKRCMFVPDSAMAEFGKLSKAVWMDVAWNLVGRCVDSAEDTTAVLACVRDEIRVTCDYRK